VCAEIAWEGWSHRNVGVGPVTTAPIAAEAGGRIRPRQHNTVPYCWILMGMGDRRIRLKRYKSYRMVPRNLRCHTLRSCRHNIVAVADGGAFPFRHEPKPKLGLSLTPGVADKSVDMNEKRLHAHVNDVASTQSPVGRVLKRRYLVALAL